MKNFVVALLVVWLPVVAGCAKSTEQPEPSNEVSQDRSASETQIESEETPGKLAAPDVEGLIKRAQILAASGKALPAIEALSQAIAVAPENAMPYRMRAEVYSAIRQDANALADFTAAIRLKPQDAALHNLRGFFLMGHGQSQRAREDFTQAIKLNPKFVQAFNNRGLVALAKNEVQQAIADFDSAISIDETYADAWNNRGFAHHRNGDSDRAIADLTKAISVNPKYVNPWNNRGLVHLKSEQFEEAIDDFTQALALSPFNVQYLQSRRAAYEKLERMEDAHADAERIRWLNGLTQLTARVRNEPQRVTNWTQRAAYFAEAGEHAAALADLERAIQLEPQSAKLLVEKARVLLAMDEPAKCADACAAALLMGPLPEAYSVRGDAFLAMEKFDEAISDYERSQRFDGAVAEAYRARAKKYEEAGDDESAKADLKVARRLNPALEPSAN